jgi:hypothetical protein
MPVAAAAVVVVAGAHAAAMYIEAADVNACGGPVPMSLLDV